MTESGCIHLSNFKASKGVQPYHTIYSFFVSCSTHEARLAKWKYCYCYVCKGIGPRLHSCFHCIFFGCYNGHIQDHARTKNHFLAVDLICGNILCFQCGDYVYDEELRRIANQYKEKTAISLGISSKCQDWVASKEDIDLLKKNPHRREILRNTTIGLRGILNLGGNTCFMSCIVQVLVHTPVLRDYFLAEQHKCESAEQGLCFACEVGEIFQQFYCGEKTPLILLKFLPFIWNDEFFVGSEQEDAHEFYLVMLNILHRHCKTTVAEALPHDNQNHCSCIVDQTFTGYFKSDIVCQSCNCVSTTVEPFRHISLDIDTSHTTGNKSNSASSNGTTDNGDSTVSSNNIPNSLLDCLEQYTRTEHLGSQQKIKCINCDAYQESTKQITIKALPIVACFHLKRFKHWVNASNKSLYRKIPTMIGFPAKLDMTPFLTHARNENGNKQPDMCCGGHITLEDNRYSLFAVVKHKGTFHGGHYIVFIRQQHDQWFKCDDHKISRVSLHEVLNSEGYLLFYHKHILEYE